MNPNSANKGPIMINSWLRKILIVVILLSLLAGVLILNSSRFNPDPSGDTEFIARAQQKVEPGITVSASALGRQESRRSFGEDLGKYDIQPIWLSIKNDTDDQLLLLSIAWTPIITRHTKCPTGSMAPFLLLQTTHESNFLSSVLTRLQPDLCTG